jgi:hypothetical protein
MASGSGMRPILGVMMRIVWPQSDIVARVAVQQKSRQFVNTA